MAALNLGDMRTRFCHIVHHTIRSSTVERLQLASQTLVTNASGRNLKAIMADFRAAFVGLPLLFTIEQLNRAYEYIEEGHVGADQEEGSLVTTWLRATKQQRARLPARPFKRGARTSLPSVSLPPASNARLARSIVRLSRRWSSLTSTGSPTRTLAALRQPPNRRSGRTSCKHHTLLGDCFLMRWAGHLPPRSIQVGRRVSVIMWRTNQR